MKLTKEAQLLKELCEIDGIGGHEKNVRKFMEREFLEVVSKEEISYDGLGSIIARKTGDPAGPKIMLAGHMDEIGMIVTKITDEDFEVSDNRRLVEPGNACPAIHGNDRRGKPTRA